MQNLLKLIAIAASLYLSGCEGRHDADTAPAPARAEASVAAKPTVPTGGESPGKPTAPISMEYEIVGNPIVGAPVLINVTVHSDQGPVTVQYNIMDPSALMFQQGQVERWQIPDPAADNVQQLSVIPQREGRLYINVSAEVMTPTGSMIRSMAIPIKVGNAPRQATVNGELKEGPDGETVISMPAEQSQVEPR